MPFPHMPIHMFSGDYPSEGCWHCSRTFTIICPDSITLEYNAPMVYTAALGHVWKHVFMKVCEPVKQGKVTPLAVTPT